MTTGVISASDSRPPVVCSRHIEESARRDLDFVDSMDQRVRAPMHQLLVGAVASIHMGDAREPGRAEPPTHAGRQQTVQGLLPAGRPVGWAANRAA